MTMAPCDREQVFWWSPPPSSSRWRFLRLRPEPENAGDLLGPCLVDRIVRGHGLSIRDIRRPRLFSIGSVMHFARDGDTVWGSGINGKQPLSELCFSRLDVRAVRGPLTAALLRERGLHVPEVYGDPGILTARFWPRVASGRAGPVYVPHMRERVGRDVRRQAHVVSPLQPLERFIDGISEASIVYATSLHGIIIAESYGIPAVLIRNQSGETRFKYDDYYQGTGRFGMPMFESLAAATGAGHRAEVPDLRVLQERLLAAFPLDLWDAPRESPATATETAGVGA